MPSYLDFDTTKSFRDFILGKTLQSPNGPQTFTNTSYQYQKLSDLPNVDPGDVTTNRVNDLSIIQNNNIYKPTQYFIQESLNVLPRRANLSLYPYFTLGNYNLIGIANTSNYDTESELFKFASSYIRNPNEKGPIYSRIQQNLEKATTGRLRVIDALNGNTATALNLLTGREPLVDPNYKITVQNSVIGKGIDFLQTVAGTELPFSTIPGDYLTNPANPINYRPVANTEKGKMWQDITGAVGSLIGVQRRPKLDRKPSDLLIEYMGQGQKRELFNQLSYSTYAPNYTTSARSQNTSKTFQFIDNTAQSVKNLLGGEAPVGNSYIGDDRGNDVKYAMNDFNDRPIRGSFYLSLMFDEVATRLFQRTKNIGDGGNKSGALTWISKNSKNKLGVHNQEWDGESTYFLDTVSTSKKFREDSILGYTQEILDSMPMDGSGLSHVGNVIDQTSRVFQEGDIRISRGSGIKYINNFTGLESGVEYCRVWTKDGSYSHMSDTMKRTGNIRKFDGSVLDSPWNLNIGPMSNGRKSFDGSSNIKDNYQFGGGFYAKKYMFSIENLAWKSSTLKNFMVSDLPACERGPNGGRIMWFPPYDLKVSEQNSAKWESNSFLGRPEPIYTYQNTERTGNLSFKIVVDHPSILNLLVREHFKGMSDEESDNYINAFFAGCQELDFYSLIKTYTTLDSNDIDLIKQYLNSNTSPDAVKELSKTNSISTTQKETTNSKGYKQPEPLIKSFYFGNDIPKKVNDERLVNETYDKILESYVGTKTTYLDQTTKSFTSLVNDNTPNAKSDKLLIFGKTGVTISDIIKPVNSISNAFDKLNTDYSEYSNKITEIRNSIKEGKVNEVTLNITTSTSEVANTDYNFFLSIRRSDTILKDFLKKLSNDNVLPNYKWPETEQLKPLYKTGTTQKFTFDFRKDLKYDYDGKLTIVADVKGENTNSSSQTNIDCRKKLQTNNLNIYSTPAFFCREGNVKLTYKEAPPKDLIPQTIKYNPTLNPNNTKSTSTVQQKPNIDVMKRIIMKTLSECYYFKKLEEDSPVAFKSLTEKLKYFHPGFHSTTPEGLNSRLTFLLQCLRPGDTIPIKGVSDESDLLARNTSFGPPPICVLRIGDFYHSKVIIRDVAISYDDSPWDLNPEGIGVQPMIATVNLQLSFIGGHGLEKPVERLQNALSSNFFGNTEMYDERSISTSTTIDGKETEPYTKEFLNSLQKLDGFDLQSSNNESLTNEITQGVYIGNIVNNTVDYTNILNNLFETSFKYHESYLKAYATIITKYGHNIGNLYFSSTYRRIKNLTINNSNVGTENIEILGQYRPTEELSVFTKTFTNKLLSAIDNSNLSNVIGFSNFMSSPLVVKSNDILTPYIKNNIKNYLNDLSEIQSIKELEIKRNNLISLIDKVNFIVKNGFDGKVENEKYTQLNFSGFTYDQIYNEYKPVIEYIKTQNIEFNKCVSGGTINFFNPEITDNILKEIISVLFINNKKEIIDLYVKDGSFSESIIKSIDFTLGILFTKPNVNKIKYLKHPERKNSNKYIYPITGTSEITDNTVKETLTKINKEKNKIENTLNFYR